MKTRTLLRLASTLGVLGAAIAYADEGMWTFDNPPRQPLKENYGFEPTPEWLKHLRLSSVRFNNGGSGSFVSPHGLVMTNHHVGMDAIQKLSSQEADYASEGFLAQSHEKEIPCADLELNVLMSMEDVTARVEAAAGDGSALKKAEKRKEEIARIAKEETDSTGLRCDVLSLYRGGQYVVYRYKKYTDVRLVMAPHASAAFFGGDFDNFTYPRYCFDYAFFRVWEDGKPAPTPHFLRWELSGLEQGDLVFVSGNPGSTGRLLTLSQVKYMRDVQYPMSLEYLGTMIEALESYSGLGDEQARQARGMLLSYNNSMKALSGYLQGLQNPEIMAAKERSEKELRAQVEGDQNLRSLIGNPWSRIEQAQESKSEIATAQMYSRLRGTLATVARQIVRYVEEIEKPDAERLDGFHEAQLESLKLSLFSPAPIYPDFEAAILIAQGQLMSDKLGADHPTIQAITQGNKIADIMRAASQSQLRDPEFRKKLVEGGKAAVDASEDPMIVLTRRLDPSFRELEKRVEETIDSVEGAAGAKVADARFKVYGTSVYPDATFSLRLSYGTVEGYEAEGTKVPWHTSFFGLYGRQADFDNKDPWKLPDVFMRNQSRVDMATPLNFVCTTDIIGGNSGSPVVDRHGRLVGLIFDGNIQSLSNRFVFDQRVARSVAVCAEAIIESLSKIYDAEFIVDEILGRHARSPHRPN